MDNTNTQPEHVSSKYTRMRSLARAIAGIERRTAWDSYRVGKMLHELRRMVGRGRWYSWLVKCDITPRTASHCATTYRRAMAHCLTREQLSRFAPSAMRVLLHPKCRTKDRLRLLELEKKGLISYHDCLSVVGWIRQVEESVEKVPTIELDKDPKWADTGRRLEALLARDGVESVSIMVFRDASEVEVSSSGKEVGKVGLSGVMVSTMPARLRSHRETLHDALRDIVGEEPVKPCTKCGQPKRPHELTLRGCVCKACERKRGQDSRRKAKPSA